MVRITYIGLVLLFAFVNVFGQKEWQFVKEKKGIKLFQRDYGTQGIKEYRAETTIKNISYHTIVAIFRDYEHFHEWVKDMKEVRNIKSLAIYDNYDYYEVNIPWPFENRDIVYHQKMFYDATDKSLNITFKGLPEMMPLQKNKVRMKESFGGWKFYRKGSDLAVVYQHYTDPVHLPANLVNVFIPDGVIDTIVRFENYVNMHTSRYLNVHYPFIKE